jgi:hypothetical protein
MMSTPNPSGTVAGSALPIRRAEELIATLPGIISVRIVPNETGAVEEIHVLTTDLVAPKNTVRNIESALMAQLGIRVNHRKISIATTLDAPRALDAVVESAGASPRAPLADARPATTDAGFGGPSAPMAPATPLPAIVMGPSSGAPSASAFAAASAAPTAAPASPPSPFPPFVTGSGVGRIESSLAKARPVPDISAGRRLLVFEDVEVRRSRSRGVLVRVTLTRDGTEYIGESEGQETERSRIDLAARATVQAIVAAMKVSPGSERGLALEGATVIGAFDREFVFVSVAARVGREPAVLTGSCEVRESAETSAVLAVLDATNRWVHLDR